MILLANAWTNRSRRLISGRACEKRVYIIYASASSGDRIRSARMSLARRSESFP